MKLAEALILRADCQKRIDQLKARLFRIAKIQEGDQPPEQPEELLAELERSANMLSDLIKRINKTNSAAVFAGDQTISEALADRDVLALRRSVYNEVAAAAAVIHNVYTRSEIKYVSTIDVGETQKRADELAKNYRELDARIQETNWKVDLSD